MAEEGQQPAPNGTLAVRSEVAHESFVETFTVREKGRRYEVAANAIANRAMMQVNVAKLRVICERALKPYLDNPEMPIGLKDFKVLAEGVQLVEDLSTQAYSDAKSGGNLANALERLVFAAAKGGAQGAKPGTSGDMPENRMRRLAKLIGKAKPVTPAPAPDLDEPTEAEVIQEAK